MVCISALPTDNQGTDRSLSNCLVQNWERVASCLRQSLWKELERRCSWNVEPLLGHVQL
ncbi:hypothetical protein Mapa_003120 [Marchantia paleacea]|nr:hypothetical protein Mapa_003120 [Marchantia paleacea]